MLQSLTLRRTVIKRPNLGPGVPTNVSVTAILEKANAIRQVNSTVHNILPKYKTFYLFLVLYKIKSILQAVQSDEREDDDSWSD